MKAPSSGLVTEMIHNRRAHQDCRSPFAPIYQSTNYLFDNTQQLLDTMEGKRAGYLYTRWGGNPTILELEQGLAKLEKAPAALAFASGMAAISSTLLTHGRHGIVCVGDLYGGTQRLLNQHLQPLGYSVTYVRYEQLEQLDEYVQPGQLVYCETPANPTLRLVDLASLAALTAQKKALLVVDNTFASPINQQPLTLGADLVVHSASKYLGGHSDLTAGAVMGSETLLHDIAAWRTSLGQMISPEVAALLSRSLRTLSLRMQQHNANALMVAQALQLHPMVEKVHYPGLPEHSDHALACRQMQGFGGVVTIEVKGGWTRAQAVADRLQLFLLATSLGGVESLVSHPVATSHFTVTPEQRAQQGITDGMLRLSVGLEHIDDLLADLEQALAG